MIGAETPAEGFLSDVALQVRGLSVEAWDESRAVEMVGRHPSFLAILGKLQRVAPHDEPVLIVGESGSGKEALAQALYLLGPRRGRAFVAVNCPQYQDGHLTVSELFGHKKGSFTGAIADRRGCFETADGGVIFLDEIADLHMSAQVMLLRALAAGEFQPLGAEGRRQVNVRVIAATNRPLDKLMVAQEFRHDLFFRLRYFLLAVPPLRARGDDWLLLLQYVLQKLHAKYGVEKRFSQRSLDLLSRYDWPGNVRQLMSLATTGYALADGVTVEPEHFDEHLDSGGASQEDSADDLYQRIVARHEDFWTVVHDAFLARDLNRAQVRAFVAKGLAEAKGSYRDLMGILGLPEAAYQRFMDFLRHHRLKP
ncbi:MAG TPA: sigma 54-interacting transcriptional regulator [Vicinamibacteria bacterium]|nr:sigma 54-interacting transcriptional regulator [Vicinamibacteria bacterium]